jgi:hypothetical protein
MKCAHCGEPVGWVKRWNGQWVVCDSKPDERARESFVEVEMGEFVSVVRHECQREEPKEKYEYVPLNRAFKGDAAHFRKRKRKGVSWER